ncbi:MAG: hypothetical protein MJ239_06945 [Bacilli bacterium]|nr:hypothetical protein [Bacilli bacterium]
MKLWKTLERYQRPTRFNKSEAMSFYLSNRVLLERVPLYVPFLKADEPFDIVRANILIRGILNKQTIEAAYAKYLKSFKNKGGASLPLEKYMNEATTGLPFFQKDKEKIMIPIFSSSLNKLYNGSYEKIALSPYDKLLKNFEGSCIDPFDYYGPSIYNSYFTKLVLLKEDKNNQAYYDYDAECIYFVNEQGRLDARVCLFDKYLHHPSHNHMLKRLAPVVECYYQNDKDGLLTSLVENNLISSRLISAIKAKEDKFMKKAYKEGKRK